MDDLSILPEEVRSMVAYLDERTYPGSHTDEAWQTVRAELLRLAHENAELHEECRHAHIRWSEFAQLAGKEQRERIRSESELAAFKRRIAEAKRVMIGTYPAHGSGYVQIICEPANGISDETFALLPVGGEG